MFIQNMKQWCFQVDCRDDDNDYDDDDDEELASLPLGGAARAVVADLATLHSYHLFSGSTNCSACRAARAPTSSRMCARGAGSRRSSALRSSMRPTFQL